VEEPVPEANLPKRIGQIAVDRGLMTPEELVEALEARRRMLADGSRLPFGEMLIDLEYISRRQLKRLLTAQGSAKRSPRQIIPGYELIKKLGEGGMGTTYLARQVSLKRLVAIKVLRQDFSKDEQFVERFKREAQLAGALDHPNIAQAIDFGQAHGLHYMVMEYVEGRIVADFIPEGGAMDVKLALHVVMQIARALEAGHKQGVIHRDIKPDNILLNKKQVAKLCDFGLAKKLGGSSHLTQTGMAVGTPYYCSPEQAQGESDVDIRSDIYSLGATLYHLVTGRLPYYAENAAAVAIKHISDPVPRARDANPNVPESVEQLICTMMAKSPARRYQTPAKLIAVLREVMSGKQIGIQVMPLDADADADGDGVGEKARRKPQPSTRLEPGRRPARELKRIETPITAALVRRNQPRALDWMRPLMGLAAAVLVAAVIYITFFHDPREAQLRKQVRAVEVWWQENPDKHKGAILRLRAVLEKARGTVVESEVRKAIDKVEADRRKREAEKAKAGESTDS
jgi:eukaryotic-like serine/threonine-protein kinase